MKSEDVDAVAEAVCKKLDLHRQEFWVEPETHYNQHKEIAQLLSDYKEVKNLFWKAFLGFAIVGAAAAALLGFSIINLSKYIPK
jgi:hypothetical protein